MNLTLIIPGLVLGILLIILLYKRLKLPPIKLKKPHIDADKFAQFICNAMFMAFFGMVWVGIWGFDWRIACIICGIAGLWFFFPREEGK